MLLVFVIGCRCSEPSRIDCYFGEIAGPIDASSSSLTSTAASEIPWAIAETAVACPDGWNAPRPPVECTLPPDVRPVSWEGPAAGQPPRRQPLELPPELPGADAPPLRLPPQRPEQTGAERLEAIRGIYGPLPDFAALPAWSEGPEGRRLTLLDLQMMAVANSPILRQAAADVEAARGALIQAGAYPNPTLGYEADTVNTLNTEGYHGGYLQQKIVTAGKLGLAQAAAEIDLANAELDLRELAWTWRRRYAVPILRHSLPARSSSSCVRCRNLRIGSTRARSTWSVVVKRPLMRQCSCACWRCRRELRSSRSSSPTLPLGKNWPRRSGLPDLPPSEVAGRADMAVPVVAYERALAALMSAHTDLAKSRNDVLQAQYQLQLARVTPIPDLETYVAVQHDYTFTPGTTTYNLQLGGEMPVFNRNRGNIISAQAQVFRAEQTVLRVRNDLTGQLAEVFAALRKQPAAGRVLSYGSSTRSSAGLSGDRGTVPQRPIRGRVQRCLRRVPDAGRHAHAIHEHPGRPMAGGRRSCGTAAGGRRVPVRRDRRRRATPCAGRTRPEELPAPR